MKTLLLAALAASVALCVVSAQAATFKTIAKGRALVMTGEIVPGDMERLAKAGYAAEARFANGQPVVERIFLNSPGGSVKAGLELAAFIREWGIDTVVGETDVCASMCAVVFAAGMHKAVFPTSKLGVHAISTFTDEDGDGSLDENLGEDGSSLALTTVVARVMADYGVPGNIITKMMTTLQPDTYWVTAADGWSDVEVLTAGHVAPDNPLPQEESTPKPSPWSASARVATTPSRGPPRPLVQGQVAHHRRCAPASQDRRLCRHRPDQVGHLRRCVRRTEPTHGILERQGSREGSLLVIALVLAIAIGGVTLVWAALLLFILNQKED